MTRPARLAAAAAASAALLTWFLLPPVLRHSDCAALGVGVHADPGEALVHGVAPMFSPEPSVHMPLTSLWATQTCRHSGPAAFKLRLAVSLAAPVLLVLVLGGLLGSPACAVAAVVLTLAVGWKPGHTLQWVYSAFVLLAAVMLAWRARAPSPGRTLAAACAIGVSLLYRSPLVFLPPLLVLCELRGARRRGAWSDAAVLLFVPYLFLLPWTAMNWAAQHRFIPLEGGEADCNVVMGALGVVGATEGDCRGFREGGQGVLRWAAAEALRAPGVYAASCARRLAFVLGLQPVLFLAALAAAWLLRRRADARAVALLALYFLLVHCLMAVQAHYFVPLWPLLAALAALAPAAASGAPAPGVGGASYRWAARGAGAALALALLLSASAVVRVAAYGLAGEKSRRVSGAELELAVAAEPGDAWLRAERGRRRLAAGEREGAEADLALAAALDPSPERLLDLAGARAALGRPAALLALAPPHGPQARARFHVLRAVALMEGGDRARAAGELSLAGEALAPRPAEGRAPADARERAVLSAMGSEARARLQGLLESALAALPRARGQAALDGFLALRPQDAVLLLRAAEAAARSGRRRDALALLGRLSAGRLDAPALRRAARLYEDLGRAPAARRLRSELARRLPGDALVRLEQAEAFLAAEDRSEALRCAGEARALRLDREGRLRLARLYSRLARHEEALALLRRLCGESPKESGLWLARAEAEHRAGRPEAALSALERAAALAPLGGPQTLRLAGLYIEGGRAAEAFDLLRLLARRQPDDPETWLVQGQAAALAGRRQEAVAALDRALALGGLAPPRRLKAAALYREAGERKRADAVLRALLSRSPGEPAVLLESARLAAAAGDEAGLRRVLGRLAGTDAPEDILQEAALLYQGLADHPRALALWDRLVKARPGAAAPLSDRGLCHYLAGSAPLAVADLRAALRLDPGFLPAYLTLGAIYSAQGLRAQAVALYDTALARPRAGPPALRAALEQSRAEASSSHRRH